MAIDYSIKAIPTTYRGRRYRSRLEAKWAAFFDLVGWQAEYEPFDLGLWSPDFLLSGTWKEGYVQQIMVEVKPIVDVDSETAEKMVKARSNLSTKDGRRDLPMLLLGTAPFHTTEKKQLNIGWIIDGAYEGEWRDIGDPVTAVDDRLAHFKWFADQTGSKIDIADSSYGLGGLLTGYDSMFCDQQPRHYVSDLMETWQRHEREEFILERWLTASNIVQWHPKAKTK